MRLGPGRDTRRRGRGAQLRRRWRHLAALLASAITVTSIIGYAGLSFTVNGLPPYPSTGWVAVLQPATGPDVDVVQLLVQARTDGDQTRAAYDVVVCGPRPYTGDLLIGGSARLSTILPNPVLPATMPQPRVQPIPDLAFFYRGLVDLGPVQLLSINLPDVSACAPSSELPPGTLPGGDEEGIVGITSGPVQQSWAGLWGWWHGPHASQAWPLTGAFPGVPPGVTGTFLAVSGLNGSWTRPLQEYAKVNAVGIPASWSVDSAVPPAAGPYPLTWLSTTPPIWPVAKLTDGPSLAQLQDWLIIFAIGFGITGSMMASLLFDWLRSRTPYDSAGSGDPAQTSDTPAACRRAQPASAAAAPPTGHRLAVIGAIIVISYARSKCTRSGHS